jgi:hypothetical protein
MYVYGWDPLFDNYPYVFVVLKSESRLACQDFSLIF